MQNHRALKVYQASHRLAIDVYALADQLPTHERFALGDQLRRAVTSIPSNIAEGTGRSTQRDFCSYLDRALGSAREIEFQLGHAESVGLVKGATVSRALQTVIVVQRMLTSLIQQVRRRER